MSLMNRDASLTLGTQRQATGPTDFAIGELDMADDVALKGWETGLADKYNTNVQNIHIDGVELGQRIEQYPTLFGDLAEDGVFHVTDQLGIDTIAIITQMQRLGIEAGKGARGGNFPIRFKFNNHIFGEGTEFIHPTEIQFLNGERMPMPRLTDHTKPITEEQAKAADDLLAQIDGIEVVEEFDELAPLVLREEGNVTKVDFATRVADEDLRAVEVEFADLNNEMLEIMKRRTLIISEIDMRKNISRQVGMDSEAWDAMEFRLRRKVDNKALKDVRGASTSNRIIEDAIADGREFGDITKSPNDEILRSELSAVNNEVARIKEEADQLAALRTEAKQRADEAFMRSQE
jgi:hypothetical protein